ncbi:MAG TPA: sulfur carrier protein ThiS [Bacteroidales bacterium]|jgi:sulfur carrier protein|nr:sulfur carrier protein ThiS [Bacteroidales bacterium]
MKITVNGEAKQYEQAVVTVADLLVLEQVASPEMVSVQRNGDFVATEQFETTMLEDGDEIDFLFFMGGGSITDFLEL